MRAMTASCNISDNMKIEIKTDAYNERRYSNAWIAEVDFTNPKGDFSFGEWIGDRRNGTAGLLTIDAEPGDIIAIGQKDLRNPSNSSPDFYLVVGTADREALRERAKAIIEANKADAETYAAAAGPALLPDALQGAYYAIQRAIRGEWMLNDCREIIHAFSGEKIETTFKGNIEVREMTKADAYKAWQAAKSEPVNPLAGFSDEQIRAEFIRRGMAL